MFSSFLCVQNRKKTLEKNDLKISFRQIFYLYVKKMFRTNILLEKTQILPTFCPKLTVLKQTLLFLHMGKKRFLIFLSVSHDKERVSRFLDVPAWRLRVSHLRRRVQQVAAGPGSPTSSRCRLQSTTWVHWNTERRWNLNNCCAVWWSGRRCGRFTSAVSESIFTTNQFIVYSKTRSTTVKNVYLIAGFFCYED